jgi:hypothetical protein
LVLASLATATLVWLDEREKTAYDTALLGIGVSASVLCLLIAWLSPRSFGLHWDRSPAQQVAKVKKNQLYLATDDDQLNPISADEWINAEQAAARLGPAQVRVVSAKIENVPLLSPPGKNVPFLPLPGKPGALSDLVPSLVLRIHVTNKDPVTWIKFDGWKENDITLKDQQGRLLQELTLKPGVKDWPRAAATGLRFLEKLEDVLVYEANREQPFDELLLELAASALGQTGTIKFRIPRSMVANLSK